MISNDFILFLLHFYLHDVLKEICRHNCPDRRWVSAPSSLWPLGGIHAS
jgi:hypothetical protein